MSVFKTGGLRGTQMRQLQKQLRLTRWAIWAEQISRAFWPVLVIVCLATAFALVGGFTVLGAGGHWLVLAGIVIALIAGLIVGGMRLEQPTELTIAERLDGSDPRRPLATLQDTLATGHGADETEIVWRAHRTRAAEAAASLKTRRPDPRLSRRDPWALRFVGPLLLIGALVGAGGSWTTRLATVAEPAKAPASTETFAARAPAVEAWATPPAYTGLATLYLNRQTGTAEAPAAITLPQGSELTIRVTDLPGLPTLSGGGLAGIESFQSLGGGLAEATGLITGSGDLIIGDGEAELARWSITMTPDTPPEITLNGVPTTTVTRALDLAFRATDDYGVVAAWAEIAPEGYDAENPAGLPLPIISYGLPLPINGQTREVDESTIRDFSSHPWAGSDVVLQLHVEDGASQLGQTEPMTITLPARRFSNPLALALVEQRRDLAMNYAQAYRVLDVLQAITRRPEAIFDDAGAYLGTRTAIRRLVTGISNETIPDVAPDVIEILWQVALSLEDGDLSDSLEQLRQAQENLRKALESGTDEDIRKAMEDLRAALDEYLNQLAQQQQNNPQRQQGQQQQNAQEMSRQDLQEMLDRLQEQAEGGMREQARDMLSELNRMLENLQAQQGQQQQGQGQQALQELQEMIQQQRDLSDQTFDELRQRRREQQLGRNGQQAPQPGQQGQQGQKQPGWGEGQGRGDEHGQQGDSSGEGRGEGQQPGQQQGQGGLAQQQEALRQQLEALSRGVGGEEAARALEEAARAMGDAANDLRDGANSDAVRDQMEALDRLNEGAEALAQEMREGQGDQQAQGNRRGQGEGRDNAQNDPFDRPTSSFGALDGRSTRVPDQTLMDRARELMEELRRRAAEPDRPQLERDYLDRLMDRF